MGSTPPPPLPPSNNETAFSAFIRHLFLGIAAVFLFLTILYLIPIGASATIHENDPFILSHTLNPENAIDSSYSSWGHSEWMTWSGRRENSLQNEFKRLGRHRFKRLDQKHINTVVIATPIQITAALVGDLHEYGSGLVWSNSLFPTYVFLRCDGGNYIIYRCPPLYIAVALVDGKPVHLGAMNTQRVTKQNNNFSAKTGCTLIN